MHEVLVNHLGGLSLPRKSVVRLTDRPDMTLDVYHGRKTITQQHQVMTVGCLGSNGSFRQYLHRAGSSRVAVFFLFWLSWQRFCIPYV